MATEVIVERSLYIVNLMKGGYDPSDAAYIFGRTVSAIFVLAHSYAEVLEKVAQKYPLHRVVSITVHTNNDPLMKDLL